LIWDAMPQLGPDRSFEDEFPPESVAKLDCDAGLVGGFAGSFGELDLAATLTLGKPLVSVGDDKGV